MSRSCQKKINSNIDAKPYAVTNVKYGEKMVTGRVIGRNKTVIPEEQVAYLAGIHCTNKEMADFFDVPLQTFVDNFRDIIVKNQCTHETTFTQSTIGSSTQQA